jgi:hypothetical protein
MGLITDFFLSPTVKVDRKTYDFSWTARFKELDHELKLMMVADGFTPPYRGEKMDVALGKVMVYIKHLKGVK